ncbi:hypothetical protein BDU57DRAFT_510634 [Ampelomyces quisqualis]|uniref:Uncharacterized protein n=1 Tax=Ampelomyces quisqualis TaxID=50730 RepID=A0A6A5R3F4_AMPQU|nr:hypothetical protein BDU57DRAFT_510634 [Ampelomyces quisqualis]
MAVPLLCCLTANCDRTWLFFCGAKSLITIAATKKDREGISRELERCPSQLPRHGLPNSPPARKHYLPLQTHLVSSKCNI